MKNVEKVRALLTDVDAILLTGAPNRYYCTEGDVSEGVALVTNEGAFYYTDSRYIEAAEKSIQAFTVKLVDRSNPYTKRLAEDLKASGVKKLGCEEESLTAREWKDYEAALGVELVPVQKAVDRLRWVKEPWELDRMEQAQKITDQAFSEILKVIHSGMTEKELQAELIYTLYRLGADGLSFDPIVVSGPNTSLPHGEATHRKLQAGDFVTMDFGVILDGYCSDMTRTVAIGYATEEMEKVYNTVLAAQLAGIGATKAGVQGKQVDGAARAVIEAAGYGEYFGHGYGHGIGLQVHEAPSCNPSGETVMEVGMVTSAEPGIYLPGKFGVRIEDLVVFTADGCRNLTKSPKNLIIL